MSFHEYDMSRKIQCEDYPFYALIMAAMRQADDHNIEILKQGFPAIWMELKMRYTSPAGRLSDEYEEVFDRTGNFTVVSFDRPGGSDESDGSGQ